MNVHVPHKDCETNISQELYTVILSLNSTKILLLLFLGQKSTKGKQFSKYLSNVYFYLHSPHLVK